MKKLVISLLFVGSCLGAAAAFAQEHYTEGPVWAVNYLRTKPGKFDDYLKYLRSSYLLLEGLGYARLALVGASLGGYACALHATVDDSPECAFVAVPALRLDRALTPRPAKLGFAIDDEVRAKTSRALGLVAPANYAPTMPVDDICVVYHEADRIADAAYTREWIDRWRISNRTALHGGHWAAFDRKARGRAWYAWLERYDFIPQ